MTKIDRGPIYLPGKEIMFRTLVHAMHFPAVQRKVNGFVEITFTVDENGEAKNYSVAKSLATDVDAEALRCLKLIQRDWLPGTLNGKPVATIVTKLFTFSNGIYNITKDYFENIN